MSGTLARPLWLLLRGLPALLLAVAACAGVEPVPPATTGATAPAETTEPTPPAAPTANDAGVVSSGWPDAGARPASLEDVEQWLHAQLPPPSGFSEEAPLVVVVAAGTFNRLAASALRPPVQSSD